MTHNGHKEVRKTAIQFWHDLLRRSPDAFWQTGDLSDLLEYFKENRAADNHIADSQKSLEGECYICQEKSAFEISRPKGGGAVNWRETLKCSNCGMINRWRSCLHLFEALCKPTEEDRVYLTETLSPVYEELAKRYPLMQSSEYFAHAPLGEMVEMVPRNVRNEDVTQLTFPDASFDSVLCFDVLEHVPDYRAALHEFCRVLSPGGRLILSVPFSFREETTVRAVVEEDGSICHLMEPCYHGDPLSSDGVLSYYDFGMELSDELKKAGFSKSSVLWYESKHWGYLGENVTYVARKPGKWKARLAGLIQSITARHVTKSLTLSVSGNDR